MEEEAVGVAGDFCCFDLKVVCVVIVCWNDDDDDDDGCCSHNTRL